MSEMVSMLMAPREWGIARLPQRDDLPGSGSRRALEIPVQIAN
jgi:hypothetical protein